jgi:hypothetical protein
MLLKTTHHSLIAGIAVISLSTALEAQDAVSSSKQVLTPWGYRDAARFHEVPDGYDLTIMPDGHVRMENRSTGDRIDFQRSAAPAVKPLPDNGWQTAASWYNTGNTVSSFSTTWKVPPAPSNYDGQTLFQFNSIEPASYDAILQPVLQYGGSAIGGGQYWAVASWYVTGTDSFASKLVTVEPGKSLTGVIKLLSQTNSSADYSCEFTSIYRSKLTVNNIAPLVWLAEVLEVYSVDSCTDYPNTPFSEMSNIDVKIRKRTPAVTWSASSGDPACGVTTTVVTQGGRNGAVDIYY